MQCMYCLDMFSNKTNLGVHQQTCLARTKWENDAKVLELTQHYEDKLTQLSNLYEDKINEMKKIHEQQIAQLQFWADKNHSSLVEIAKQRTQITNHVHNTKNTFNISGPLDLSQEKVCMVLDKHLTTDVIGDGQRGLAQQ